jgi:hypothetical protein
MLGVSWDEESPYRSMTVMAYGRHFPASTFPYGFYDRMTVFEAPKKIYWNIKIRYPGLAELFFMNPGKDQIVVCCAFEWYNGDCRRCVKLMSGKWGKPCVKHKENPHHAYWHHDIHKLILGKMTRDDAHE